ncbi:MSMEG_1061 family FMN-dependent PPOX-type flavoprotein [Roseomonas xinghualingensis]|uniref:MSMEG_1061 family FMN-dependent PPOX-type flavoprotein n=1 Tax=Roseomonas xinghualingensis TaxID=2986475 RepID=UPI0021F0C7A7|nr:MSMEG_1061 family FMN-dependent PPOX-type flavoprotein [Roseomonas sp. SXEYE001]MCV4207362.1 pyridoxamine 5'-phosphate oxidase family protein [Roseomonas sp. SXEYE001]
MDANPTARSFDVTTPEALAALYPVPSAIVLSKATDRIEGRSAAFIARSPFCVLSTIGARGPHATPRGDAPGFVTLLDEKTLVLPDRRGNNRLDALRDVLDDPRVALLFLVPGMGETLRVHGTARITTDPELRERLAMGRAKPASVLVISVTEVYMQCPRALLRAELWSDRTRPEGVPTGGELIAEHTKGRMPAEDYDNVTAPNCAANLY